LEEGSILCQNGQKEIVERYNKWSSKGNLDKSKDDSHNFDKEQLRGLSPVGEHLMERTQEMIEARMAQSGSYGEFSAFGAPQPQPPAGAPPLLALWAPSVQMRGYSGVFKRIGEGAKPAGAAKKMRFMDKIGHYED
jgi:hypothetical protein